MHARLLYWFNLSVGISSIYFLFLIEQWGKSPLPITEFLLAQETDETKALWWYVDSGISRYWNILTVPFLASTLVLHNETDDFYETFGFLVFGLIAYGFLYLANTEAYSLYFLIVLGVTIGFKLSARNALRVTYTILVFCGCYTWLFPAYSSGILMFALFAIMFSVLVVSCLIIRLVFKKFQIFGTKAT